MSTEKNAPELRRSLPNDRGANRTSRTVATLILVPSVPMLIASVAALALFYLAPTRFGDLISRLPGETFIRTALVFAPATLFAIVVLAALYAVEKPAREEIIEWPAATPSHPRPAPMAKSQFPGIQRISRFTLTLLVPGLMFSVGVWALSFISPDRFERLIEPLPGDRFLRPLVDVAPVVLFALTLIAVLFAFARDGRAWLQNAQARITRLAVRSVLILAVPAFLLTLGALGLLVFSPLDYERIFEHLPYEEFMRLALMFAPAILLAVVLLSVLYLRPPYRGIVQELAVSARKSSAVLNFSALRARLAPWILVGGLALTTTLGLGVLGAGIYLLLK